MQHRSKGSSSLQRRSSSTAHLPKQSPPAFRTLLKRRNETIPAGQLYETSPNPPPTLTKRTTIHADSHQDIKQYVKTMGSRIPLREAVE